MLIAKARFKGFSGPRRMSKDGANR